MKCRFLIHKFRLTQRSAPANHVIGHTMPAVSNTTLRQFAIPHQISITFTGGAAAFVKSPYDKTLPTAAVAGGKDTRDRGAVLLEFCFDITARVPFKAERIDQRLLRSEESHRQEYQSGGPYLFGTGHRLWYILSLVIFLSGNF